ncbi:peptidyl-prolyl cis-trans isomerase FKBP5 [Siniperca chuatsi]|nr:peptidyl-prolyl cis-trans isomerase FKBP5 [Siniperca chuatsi]XP_044025941.1 peptidyl-prolyl cis-trans isomerase FKBP5 [Siniperca chuatsi]XP_044025949.1 peptidyl-prolyl cis-trans isomerase FKBP5 [Siniperca chuatsi]XP_044025957.1 peptidyl-prolyl cis-trans isomerase FKBP5 [Siniperca chuatsi]XP_044025966.1 peptidyl-prolyl cis-trans isomerase FKBP5 [Siniperca chuatsi]XP_044025974.1 peptidyl-prolyl cis-trans isomerase FKBP5 [Siniperca chuatsi]UMW88582.1 peptidyl-prolyl cis-trans isomerase FKBP5 
MTTDQDLPMDGQSATAVFAGKGIDVTPDKDHGVIKVVMRQGLDGDRPMIGDRVTVHYTGKLLTGKKFDCSRDRKEPFCFNVGKGQVLKAWDIGVLSMQRGEVCTFLCKPEYAYGAAGNPDKIPPSSSVVFEMELLKFEGEMLTEDGGIIRRIKVKGDGYNNPNDGASVDVHLEGSCGGRLFDCRDVSFIVGEAEDKGVPHGVDQAMDKMQKGECCVLYLKPKYGFGSEGKPEYKIGPDKDIIYEVTLKDFQRAKESWEMDLKEKLDLAPGVKHKGNQYFKTGRYYPAVTQYQRIVVWLEMECGSGVEQQKRIQDFILTSHLNLALCFLRIKEFSQVVENCNKAIEIDESNEKALYRRGVARLLRNEFSLAMADFQQVLQVNPSNRAARAQISTCQRKIKEHHEQDKRTYANMFQKFAERDATTGKTKKRRDESASSGMNGEVGIKRQRRSRDCPL